MAGSWHAGGNCRLTLRSQLLLALAAGVVPLLIVAFVTTALLRTVNQDFRRATQRAAAAAQIAAIQARITESGTAVTGALTASPGSADRLNTYLTANSVLPSMFARLLRDVPVTGRPAVRAAASGWQAVSLDLQRLSLMLDDPAGAAGREVMPLLINIGQEVVAPDHALEVAAKLTADGLKAQLTRSHARQRDQQILLLLMAFLGVGLVAMLSRRLRRTIGRPLSELKRAVERLDPDSEERLEPPRTPELAALAESFNAMADRLANTSRQIAESEARLSALFANASDVVLVLRPDASIASATPSAQRLLGLDPAELKDRSFVELVVKNDRPLMLGALAFGPTSEPAQFRLLLPDGSSICTETYVVDLTDEPAVQGFVLTVRDVSERRRLEDRLSHQAFHDALTGLPNRALLRDRLDHALQGRRSAQSLAVLFIDLDDFKTVNDSLGHSAGDELLQIVAARLELHLRAGDTAARVGGDEFVVLLENVDEQEALATAHRIRRALAEPASMAGIDVSPRASIGLVLGGEPRLTAEALLAHADAAMYLAKTQESGGITVYGHGLAKSVLRRLELKAELQRAVDRSEIEVAYQPVIDVTTGRVSGVEARAKWRHPAFGDVAPDEFMPLAEQTGLAVAMGNHVLTTATAHFARWRDRFRDDSPGFLSLKISARELREPGLAERVAGTLARYAIEPSQVILEVAERVLFASEELVVRCLKELKTLGVRLCIDSFGTGYASLAHLQRLPVDFLKLDADFVAELKSDAEAPKVVAAAIINLGHHLGLRIVADGVDSEEQAGVLRLEGCDFWQGSLFAVPQDQDGLAALLS